MASQQGGDEILSVQGTVGPSVDAASAEIRAKARALNQTLMELEQLRAQDEIRLAGTVDAAQRAFLQSRLAGLAAATEQTKVLIKQQEDAWTRLNATVAQRPAGAAGAPPPPPTPPAPPAAGGGAGLGGFLGGVGLAALGQWGTAIGATLGAILLVKKALEEGLSTLESWVEQGVEVNKQFQIMQVGLQAEIAANYRVTDAQGQELTGLEKINALRQTGVDLQEKVVAAAYSAGQGIEAFTTAYRAAIPFGAQANMNLEQTLEIVRRLAIVANAVGLPFEAAKFQIAQILRGGITIRTMLAQQIGLTPAEDRAAKDSGQLLDLLMKKTQDYAQAQGTLAQTFQFVAAQADVLKQKVLAAATEGGFKEMAQFGREILDSFVQIDSQGKLQFVDPNLKTLIADANSAFKEFVRAALDAAPLIAKVIEGIGTATKWTVQALSYGLQLIYAQQALGLARALNEAKSAEALGRGSQSDVDAITAALALKQEQIANLRNMNSDLDKAGADFNKSLEALAARAQSFKYTPPSLAGGAVGLQPGGAAADPRVAAENALAAAAEKAATIEKQRLDLLVAQRDVQAGRGALSMTDIASAEASFKIQDDELKVAEARAKLAGAMAAEEEQSTGARRVSVANAERALTVAQENLEKDRQAAATRATLAAIDEKRITVNQQIAAVTGQMQELDGRRVELTLSDYAAQRNALSVQLDGLNVTRADLALQADKAGKTLNLQVQGERALALAEQQRKTEEARYALIVKTGAEQRKLNDEVALGGAATTGRAAAAAVEDRILAAQKAEVAALGDNTLRGQISLSAAQGRLAVEEAILRSTEAETKLDEDQLRLEQAMYALRVAVQQASGNMDAPEVVAAELAVQKAGLQVQQDEYAVSVAKLNVVRQTTDEYNKQLATLNSVMQSITTGFSSAGNAVKFMLQNLSTLFPEGKKLFDIGAALVDPLVSGIKELSQPGTLNKILGGASIGAAIGSIIPGVGTFVGAIIGQAIGGVLSTKNIAVGALEGFLLGGPVGGILGGFFASERKNTDRIFKQIQAQVAATIKLINDGTGTIKEELSQLEAERADAIKRLSGKKGGSADLKTITDQINQAEAQLLQAQKQIFDSFQSQLRVLEAGPNLSSPAQAIEQLNQSVKQFLDAGGSALDADKYVALTLQNIFRDTNATITSAQQSTIDLLQQEVDLAKQRADTIKQANDQENQIREQFGLVRVQSAAQSAGQQIAAIEATKKAQLEADDAQQAVLDAQVGGLAELFGLSKDELSLQVARLAIIKEQTQATVDQVKALQEFLSLNAAAFAAANSVALAPGVTVPSIVNGALVQGAPTVNLNFGPGSISINGGPGSSPQTMWQQFTEAIKQGVGTHPWLLSSTR